MRVWWFVGAIACNHAFGLEPTALDEIPIDAPPPPSCTADVPSFSPLLEQMFLGDCVDYSTYGRVALARCDVPDDTVPHLVIGEATDDEPFLRADIMPQVSTEKFGPPFLTPEGDELVVLQIPPVGGVPRVASVYRRVAERRWDWSLDLPFTFSALESIGAPSRAPTRHIMINRTTYVDELADDGNNVWSTVTYTFGDLGVDEIYGPLNLTADGLRVVFSARVGTTDGVFFSARTSVGTRFSGSALLDVPYVRDAFLVEDCSRLYFSGIGSIFYARRR